MCENEVCCRVEKLKTLQSIKGQEKRSKKRGNDEWRSKQRDGRESGEPSQAFGCLCYQFVQKCQSGVTFSPTASPAARPLFSNTTPSAADNTNTEVRAERANKRCSAAYCMQYSIKSTLLMQFSHFLALCSISCGYTEILLWLENIKQQN